MKLLSVASECAPFVKTGGLADVVGALPAALAAHGVDSRVILPLYPALQDLAQDGRELLRYDDMHGGPVRLLATRSHEIDLLLIEAPHLYDREGTIYLNHQGNDWPDNMLRFGALCRVAADIALGALDDWAPDIVHAHDWQAGLVPVYLRQSPDPAPPCVMTIHNIAFQGLFEPSWRDALGIDPHLFSLDGLEYFGKIGFLKGGLVFCDKITTVSPTYARELMTEEFGMGLEGLLQSRSGDVTGILNGIDLDVWNPETDEDLPAPYSARALKTKSQSRAKVQERFGLSQDSEGPLYCVVSRLTTQKGLDLLLDVIPTIVEEGGQLALLGSGDKMMEASYVAAAHRHAGSVGVIIGYDEPLAHLLQGGSDAILVPSRFEPCGLTQLYALRYGTIPVVAHTGGLADTVIDANPAALAAGCATGVQFVPVTAHALDQAIRRSAALFRQPKQWKKMVQNAMKQPVGWDRSSVAYLDLFRSVLA